MNARTVLNHVEKWASGYWMIRETGLCFPDSRRIDALLVPVGQNAHCLKTLRCSYFDRSCLVGVEVKVSRSDFLKGLNSGQFEGYDEHLAGMYVAGPRGVFKANEVPAGIGVLTLRHQSRETRITCQRHPKYTDARTDTEQLWRIFHKLWDSFIQEQNRRETEYRRGQEKIGRLAAGTIFRSIRDFHNQLQQETGDNE